MDAQALRRRFALTLPGELEQEFLELFFRDSLGQMRVALLLATFLYAAFGLLDAVAAPGVEARLWTIRYAIICPLILAVFAFTFAPPFRHAAQLAMSVVVASAGIGIVVMTMITPPPANYLYHAGLILVLMYAFGFARMRFVWASGTSALVIAIYLAVTVAAGKTPSWIVLNNSFFLVSAFILGGFACYSLERYARRNFVQRREIETKNDELVRTNAELVESRQMVIESSKRAQLIFSALADALPGTDLEGKYRLEEKIGSGAFGTVYRARHLLLDAPVAVKVFRPVGGHLEKSFEKFRLEGISGKKINHPNAVTVLDFGVANSAVAFLVMELLEGHTLADEIRAQGRIPPKRCVEIAVPICSVLAEAHANGIIHRDIKPGNIFLHHSSKGEIVKVVDFGIAKLLESSTDDGREQVTMTEAIVGTPNYMSPERLALQRYGPSSDVYSVGIVLYEMLTGHVPKSLGAADYSRTLMAHLTAEAPKELSEIVMSAMASDPEMRPTALDLTRRIAALYGIPVPGPQLITEQPLRRQEPGVSADAPTAVMKAAGEETQAEG